MTDLTPDAAAIEAFMASYWPPADLARFRLERPAGETATRFTMVRAFVDIALRSAYAADEGLKRLVTERDALRALTRDKILAETEYDRKALATRIGSLIAQVAKLRDALQHLKETTPRTDYHEVVERILAETEEPT